MRDLKFRAWDKIFKFYVGEDELYLGITFDGKFLIYKDEITDEVEFSKIDDYILEQYTGLKDKNGKEIYGGDIVKCHSTADEPCLAVVRYGLMPDICGHEYCPCRIGFYLDDKVYFDEDFGEDDDHGEIEVIGNIHENPELVGGEDA